MVSHRGWTALKAAGVHEAVERIVVPVYARMTHDRDGKLTRLPYSIDEQGHPLREPWRTEPRDAQRGGEAART